MREEYNGIFERKETMTLKGKHQKGDLSILLYIITSL